MQRYWYADPHQTLVLRARDIFCLKREQTEGQTDASECRTHSMSTIGVGNKWTDSFRQTLIEMFLIYCCDCMLIRMTWCSDASKDSVWLIAPLIAKLSSVVQGRILKHAGQVLETGNNFWTAKNTKERERCLQKRHVIQFIISVCNTHSQLQEPRLLLFIYAWGSVQNYFFSCQWLIYMWKIWHVGCWCGSVAVRHYSVTSRSCPLYWRACVVRMSSAKVC